MNKTYRFVVPFVMVLLVLGLTLPACTCQKPETETPPTPPSQPGALTFEAAEYTNADYGFSIKYPKDWTQQPNPDASSVFIATAAKRVPALSINIQDGSTFNEALTTTLSLAGSSINITSESPTTLADGTAATQAVVKWKAQGLSADTFALGVQKDGKWIIVGVSTASLLAKYDEALFSEIVHTLQFN